MHSVLLLWQRCQLWARFPAAYYYYFFKSLFERERERERETVQAEEEQTETETQNPKQDPGSKLSAQS